MIDEGLIGHDYDWKGFHKEGELVLPGFQKASDPKELDGDNLVWLDPDSRGNLTITFGDGSSFKYKGWEDLPKLFKGRFNWTYSRNGVWDCLFKGMPKEKLVELDLYGKMDLGSFQIYWVIGTNKIRYTERNNNRTTKYLINTAGFIVKSFPVSNLDELGPVVGKLLEFNKIVSLNITSLASTVKDLLLSELESEFKTQRYLTRDDLDLIRSSYKGPRMETTSLGTLSNIGNADLTKAYLRALAELPSLDSRNVAIIDRGDTFIQESHPGSTYRIYANVPESYANFGPLPLRTNGHVTYPTGEFVTVVSKDYIELLMDLGDIPFQIISSTQIVLVHSDRPYEYFCQNIEYFEEAFKDKLYPINLKGMHVTLHGHMLHTHIVHDKDYPLNSKYHTSQDYNPVLATAIQAAVAIKVWREAIKYNASAIRVDAISASNLPTGNGFKTSPPGTMTFLTPSLKDKPGSTVYRDLIYAYRDWKSVPIEFQRRVSVKDSWNRPQRIGVLESRGVEIFPTPGSRVLAKDIKMVGELLDSKIPTRVPSIKQLEVDSECLGQQDKYLWVDEYLRLFPQTQISTKIGKMQ